ncbi:hypothetical protein ACFVT9_22165 [Kitasatospora cineracea]|uniref:hypothetical protein n=1 Tax=Kitasatospora cineracea TaxID=88074 RepID=UPI0036D91015
MMKMHIQSIDPKDIDVNDFLALWFGAREDVSKAEVSGFAPLPDGLREWFDLVAHWKVPLAGAKALFLPSDMAEEEGKYIFMGDHGGWSWAFDPDSPLTVYEAKDDEPWRPLRGKWLDFFFYHLFTEAIGAAPMVTWCADISEGDLGRVLCQFSEVLFGDSKWPASGWRWYMSDGLVADAGPRIGAHGRFALTIGAKSKGAIERLDLPSQLDWRVRENV